MLAWYHHSIAVIYYFIIFITRVLKGLKIAFKPYFIEFYNYFSKRLYLLTSKFSKNLLTLVLYQGLDSNYSTNH